MRVVKDLAPKGREEDFEFYSTAFDQSLVPVDEYLPTGLFALDRLMGGGWPVGRMVEVSAWEGVGKSTLVDQSIGEVQRIGGQAALIDTEGARHPPYMRALGVDLEKLIRLRAETIEDCFRSIELVLDAQEHHAQTHDLRPLLIVWDSVGGTPSMAEILGDADDRHMMVAARNIKMNLRRIHGRLHRARAALVLTNHFYVKPGQGFATRETYGGSGLKYFSSFRLWLTRKGSIKMGTEIVGHEVEAMLKKNRLGPAGQKALAGLSHGRGFDNAFTLLDWAMEHGGVEGHCYVTQRGAWYTFSRGPEDADPITFQRGFVGFGQLLHDHPDIYEKLATEYLRPLYAPEEKEEPEATD